MKTTSTSATFINASEVVALSLDSETLAALNGANESSSETACSVILVSDDHDFT